LRYKLFSKYWGLENDEKAVHNVNGEQQQQSMPSSTEAADTMSAHSATLCDVCLTKWHCLCVMRPLAFLWCDVCDAEAAMLSDVLLLHELDTVNCMMTFADS